MVLGVPIFKHFRVLTILQNIDFSEDMFVSQSDTNLGQMEN